MKYIGSKNRIAKYILPAILHGRKENQFYVEPFTGGANLIDKVSGKCLGNDNNYYLIAFLKELQKGWLPPEKISEVLYKKIKANKTYYPSFLVGYVGFQLSWGASWFGTYRKDKIGIRDYSAEAYRNVKKQQKYIKNITFTCGEYQKMSIPPKSIIYCDPPYKGYDLYPSREKFNYENFYSWVREKASEGHKMYISEYNMPQDFKCIWNQELISGLNGKKQVEKLFILEPK